MTDWMRDCVDKMLSCNSVGTGNGTGMKQAGDLIDARQPTAGADPSALIDRRPSEHN